MGALDASAFSVAKLKDYRTSYIEVLKLKEDVLQHLIGDWMDALQMESDWRSALCDVFKDRASVRARYVPHADSEAQADSAWLVGAPGHVSLCADVLYRQP